MFENILQHYCRIIYFICEVGVGKVWMGEGAAATAARSRNVSNLLEQPVEYINVNGALPGISLNSKRYLCDSLNILCDSQYSTHIYYLIEQCGFKSLSNLSVIYVYLIVYINNIFYFRLNCA